MSIVRRLRAVAPLGIAYFIAAAASLWFTRFGNDVVFLWAATAVMATDLNAHSRKSWGDRTCACLVGCFAAAALMVPMTHSLIVFPLANIFEGLLASFLLSRWRRSSNAPLGSLPWLGSYVVPVGLVVPAIVALLLLPVAAFAPPHVPAMVLHIVLGHALSNVIFVPLVQLVRRHGPAALLRASRMRRGREAALLLGVTAVIAGAVFFQNALPLLFLPMLPIILIAFRLGYVPGALAVTIVAIIGTALTLNGFGPIQLFPGPVSGKLLFLQFYLASVLMTALPIAAELEYRSRLHRQLRESETRYRMIAEHRPTSSSISRLTVPSAMPRHRVGSLVLRQRSLSGAIARY